VISRVSAHYPLICLGERRCEDDRTRGANKPTVWEAAAEMEAKKKKIADAVRLAEQKQAEQTKTPLRGVVDAIEAARNEEGAEGKVDVKR
jgi:cytochrome c556